MYTIIGITSFMFVLLGSLLREILGQKIKNKCGDTSEELFHWKTKILSNIYV